METPQVSAQKEILQQFAQRRFFSNTEIMPAREAKVYLAENQGGVLTKEGIYYGFTTEGIHNRYDMSQLEKTKVTNDFPQRGIDEVQTEELRNCCGLELTMDGNKIILHATTPETLQTLFSYALQVIGKDIQNIPAISLVTGNPHGYKEALEDLFDKLGQQPNISYKEGSNVVVTK